MIQEERSIIYLIRDGRIELEKAVEQIDKEQDDLYFQLEEIINRLNDIERELEEREEEHSFDEADEEGPESFRESRQQSFTEDDYFQNM